MRLCTPRLISCDMLTGSLIVHACTSFLLAMGQPNQPSSRQPGMGSKEVGRRFSYAPSHQAIAAYLQFGCSASRAVPTRDSLTANRMLHCGGQLVTRDDIANVSTPMRARRWIPAPHHRLLEFVESTIRDRGFWINNQTHGLRGGGSRYFGLLELPQHGATSDCHTNSAQFPPPRQSARISRMATGA